MTLGVRGAVFDETGRIFLIRHTYTPGWHMPGGGVERGETFADALARELEEEGGFVLEDMPQLFGLYLNRVSGRDHVALYVCRRWRQPRPPRVPNLEIRDCGFFPADALPQETTAATRRRLAEIAGEAAPTADW
jgi:8-oxo-dGTP pyrophosphatase MutT (NUDIX family)